MVVGGTGLPPDSGAISCIHELVQHWARLHPQAVAVSDAHRSCTYEELECAANRLAHRLVRAGVEPDTLVGLSVPRGVELIVGALGILKAGGAYVPLDPAYPVRRLEEMIEDAALRIVVCTRATVRVAGAVRPMLLDDSDDTASSIDDSSAPPDCKAHDRHLAYAIFTSGSTGRAKASLLEHRGLVNLANEQARLFGVSVHSRVLQFASFSFDAATFEWIMALARGAQLSMPDEQTVKSPSALTRFVQQSRITHATLPPAVLPLLDRNAWASVTTIIVAGEACSRELAEQWCVGRAFYNAYGPSEMTVWCTTGEFRPAQPVIHIGKPIANTQCLILDEAGAVVRPGEAGELYVAGVGISRGYLRRPELTGQRFLPNPFSPALSPRMFRTGDRAREMPDGNLEFLGRVDRQVKIRGFRVEPEEIEACLARHPAVVAAVVESMSWQGTMRLVAYVSVDQSAVVGDTGATRASVSRFRAAFDRVYRTAPQLARAGADSRERAFSDFTGWISSYSQAQIPERSMRDWRDATAARIRALGPGRVLEVGCGAGLLLAPLAGHCSHYTATDISAEVVARLGCNVHLLGEDASKVELHTAVAHDLDAFRGRRFDTIVVNSVIQYFPNEEYLRSTLERLVGLLDGGGSLFIGDVRHLAWNEVFHASVEQARNPGAIEPADFIERVRQRLRNEPELVVAPEYFLDVIGALAGVAFVEVLPKLGREQNEMNQFRFDVVVHGRAASASVPVQSEPPRAVPALRQWAALAPLGDRDTALREILAAHDAIVIRDIPNARIVADSPGASMDPVDWVDVAARHDCEVEFALGTGAGHDRFHVLLRRGARNVALTRMLYDAHASRGRGIPERSALCTDPARSRAERGAEALLRDHLREQLPAYMQPAIIMLLPHLPVTPNGKVDRRALPTPSFGAADDDEPSLTATQRSLRQIWQRVLGTQRVSVWNNFNELGGDSLSAATMAAEVTAHFDIELEWNELHAPTLARLADRIELHVARRALLEDARRDDPHPHATREVFRL